MIPTHKTQGGTVKLPTNAAYWMPSPGDISDEGFSYFRDTWLIRDTPVRLARELMAYERRLATAIANLAIDEEHFDKLASAVENGDPSGATHGVVPTLTPTERAALDEFLLEDEPAALESLELGVAGLVYALSTVRILPAASCRGHPGSRAWSEAPVVLFATTEYRAQALEPLVTASGCRFDIDAARPELLVIRGRSILNTMALADLVMQSRASFVRRRPPKQRRPKPPATTQQQLF